MRRAATLFLVALACLIGGIEMQSRHSRPAIAWYEIKSLVLGPVAPAVRAPVEKPVPCPSEALTVLVIGQSHGANYIGERFSSEGRTFVAVNGKCYRAIDPLPGTDGEGGNLWTEVGNRLASRASQDVLLVNTSIGATSIRQWAPGGDLHDRLMNAVRQRPAKVWAVAIQIGESDYSDRTPRDEFARDLRATIGSLRKAGVDAPVFVARESRLCSPTHPVDPIAAAQIDVLDPARRIFAGPDLNAVTDRYDGCHFSGSAARNIAAMWVELLYPAQARGEQNPR